MLKINFALQTISFIAMVRSGCAVIHSDEKIVPDFTGYNPLQSEGYEQKTDTWHHFDKDADLSASVADFTSESGECVRVVVFTGQQGATEDIKVSCNSLDPFVGLVPLNQKLWYFGTAFVKRLGKRSYSSKKYNNRFIIVKGNEDLETCEKTWWIIEQEDYFYPQEPIGKSPQSVNALEDEDCKELISQQNIPPMMIYSPNGEISQEKPSGGWSTFNAWEIVGAGIREYRDKAVCFQLLVLYSYGRPLDSMKVACGQLRGVSMTDRTFYYGRTVMVKVHDDLSTFTVFYHPRNGRTHTESTKGKRQETLPSVCVKKTYRLVKTNERYIKKRLTTIVEYVLGPDCKDLVEGKVEGGLVENEKINDLLNNLNKEGLSVTNLGADILGQMTGYKMERKINDFNIAKELGAIVMFFEKSKDEKRQVVLAVARGVVLDGVIVEVHAKPEGSAEDENQDSIVSRGDVLVHNRNLMLKKSSEGFKVLVSKKGSGCSKNTYILKSLGGKETKEKTGTQTVDKTDPDCNDLLTGSHLMSPEAKTYNSATSLSAKV